MIKNTQYNYSYDFCIEIKNNGFEYKLPIKQIEIFEKILKHLKISDRNSIRKTHFTKKWISTTAPTLKMINSFSKEKPTLSPIQQIIQLMNKLNTKNYNDILNQIITLLQNEFNLFFSNTIESQNLLYQFFDLFYVNTISNNLYAQLFSDLLQQSLYSTNLYNVLNFKINYYLTNICTNIKYIDIVSDDNYDLFCEINKENIQRKNITNFFKYLHDLNIISDDKMIYILQSIGDILSIYLVDENKKYIIDELIECLCLLYNKHIHNIICIKNNLNNTNWNELSSCLQKLITLNNIDGLGKFVFILTQKSKKSIPWNGLSTKSFFKLQTFSKTLYN